jgi:uncharacterized protein (UPF0332 family)
VSPRSSEFMEEARDRLEVARVLVKSGHPGSVVSAAYYAMLNAANAALSERGEHAKTHSGSWTLFSATFVAPGEFDQGLSVLARKAKDAREKGDYEAAPPSAQEAAEYVDGAGDFLAAIEAMLADAADPPSDDPDSKD